DRVAAVPGVVPSVVEEHALPRRIVNELVPAVGAPLSPFVGRRRLLGRVPEGCPGIGGQGGPVLARGGPRQEKRCNQRDGGDLHGFRLLASPVSFPRRAAEIFGKTEAGIAARRSVPSQCPIWGSGRG